MPQIEEAYIKTGLVKYVVRDFPLEQIHHDAFKAAEAAHCAGDRGAFWPMHARLFARQTDLTLDELPGHAQMLGLDVAAFRQCLESGIIPGWGGTQRLLRLIGPARTLEICLTGAQIPAQEALRMGLVNKVVPEGMVVREAKNVARTENVPAADQKMRVVRMVRGAQSFDAFKEIIDGLLARSPS